MPEHTHQVIFQRHIELRRGARITLAGKARPRNCLSTRRLSLLLPVPMIARPLRPLFYSGPQR